MAFDDQPTPTGEHPADRFLRQFKAYRGMREQVGASAVARLILTREEEAALWSAGQADDNDEPCVCHTDLTCLAKQHDQPASR